MDKQKLINSIRKIVKEEVHKILKPMINEVLAEKYMNVLSESKNSLTEVYKPQSVLTQQKETSQIDREKMRKAMIQKIAGNDPIQQMMYEDIDFDTKVASLPDSSGGYIDSDDEGVDISQFGF